MEKKVDIFLIFVLNVMQVQKAISYHLISWSAASQFWREPYPGFDLSKRI